MKTPKYIKTDHIERGNYEGYVWMSNNNKPDIIDGEYENELNPSANPFIIEAQLFNGTSSYSVRYVDGRYHVLCYEVNPEDLLDNDVISRTFQSHRMEGKILSFLEYWKEENDELCMDMPVLVPAVMVFIGFDK